MNIFLTNETPIYHINEQTLPRRIILFYHHLLLLLFSLFLLSPLHILLVLHPVTLTNLVENTYIYMSCVMRKPAFCICENTDADQLRDNRATDQRFCFRYIDCTIPLLAQAEVSSLIYFSEHDHDIIQPSVILYGQRGDHKSECQ